MGLVVIIYYETTINQIFKIIMNVKQLKELIMDLPDNMEVIIQRDPEGNSYSPLDDADPNCIYLQQLNEVYSTLWDHHDAMMEKEEWDEFIQRPKTLVLSPLN
jgi:hypothetical protein